MMRGMHPLLRAALLVCPAEFRRHWAGELSADLDRRRAAPLPLGSTCLNIAWTGVRLHVENVWRDVSYAVRILAKAPVFVVVAVLTITLAIAANVTAFSILKGILLDPLPYAHGDRLAFISRTTHGADETNIDYPDTVDFGNRGRAFSEIAVEAPAHATLSGNGGPVEISGWYVGGDYFRVFGVRAELGRLLSPSDMGTRRIVISDELWRQRFDSSADVLGRRITLSGRTYSVAGVAPAHLLSPGPGFMAESDYWIPIEPRSANFRGNNAFYAIGRLRDGVTFAQAQADLSRIMAQIVRKFPNGNPQRGVLVRPLVDTLTAPTRMLIVMLYAAAILVLLIAAANIMNLQLVRAAAREREIIVRSALGATKKRLAVQLAAEVGLLSTGALLAAVALTWFCLNAISGFFARLGDQYGMRMIVPGWEHVRLNAPVLVYAVILTLLFTAIVPALPAYMRGANLAALLSAGGRTAGVERRAFARAFLATCELALAFAVVCVGALLFQSFAHMERTPVGFVERNVYAVGVDLPNTRRYFGYPALERFYARAESAFREVPGVADAAEALVAGLGSQSNTDYSLRHGLGVKTARPEAEQTVEYNCVTPRFFSTVEIPLLRGRLFAATDTSASQPVAIVSQSFAAANFGGMNNAIGKYVSVGESTGATFPLRRIVGVVGDVRHFLGDPPRAEVYLPFSQVTVPGEIVVRTNGDDPHLANDLTAALAKIDPTLAPPQIVSFLEMRSINELMTKIGAIVFFTLAAIALLLALAGVYGVVAYSAERRTHEFGVRISLGAHTSTIAGAVIREALVLCGIGVAIGTILAALAARGLTQMLYQTSPLDPAAFIGAAFLLALAVLLATCVPMLRAMRVQPATALRYE